MEPTAKYITGIYYPPYTFAEAKHPAEEKRQAFFERRPMIIDKNNPHLFFDPEFEWGSRTRGTKQLAISILLEVAFADKVKIDVSEHEAIRYGDLLVEHCLSLIPSKRNFKIQIHAIRSWMNYQKNLTNTEIDLLQWTKIEEPEYLRPPVINMAKEKMIIPPPPISSIPTTITIPEKSERQSRYKTKYPFAELEVGDVFYCLNPSPEILKRISAIAAQTGKRQNKKFIRRQVSAQWAREQQIVDIPQSNATICIIWRIA